MSEMLFKTQEGSKLDSSKPKKCQKLECYFAFQKLKKQSANVGLDSDFKFTVFIWKSFY